MSPDDRQPHTSSKQFDGWSEGAAGEEVVPYQGHGGIPEGCFYHEGASGRFCQKKYKRLGNRVKIIYMQNSLFSNEKKI